MKNMRFKVFCLCFLFVSFLCKGQDLKESLKYARMMQDVYADVAKKALPAVVTIKTARRIKQYYYVPQRRNVPLSPFGYNFFHRGKIVEKDSPPMFSGQASGFIINPAGYIITNCHVIKGQTNFIIKLNNGKEYKGEIVGMDPETDIAVLKIDTGYELPYLKFADPDTVKVGHFAIAIGAPYGLGQTVTTGIVSYKGRTTGLNPYENYIQTDASINPGNSGGPLLNIEGEVMGVNDFILTPPGSKGNIGLAFAISGNLAENVSKQLIESGKAEKPWLGVAMNSLSNDELQRLGNGVKLVSIGAQSPADLGGLCVGDVIKSIDGKEIKEPADIKRIILSHRPGDKININLIRNETEDNLTLKIGVRKRNINNQYWRFMKR